MQWSIVQNVSEPWATDKELTKARFFVAKMIQVSHVLEFIEFKEVIASFGRSGS